MQMKDKSKLKCKSIKCAITAQMENDIFDYCARNDTTISKFIRQAITNELKAEVINNG